MPGPKKPEGEITLEGFARELRDAFANTGLRGDPWVAVALRALELAPLVRT